MRSQLSDLVYGTNVECVIFQGNYLFAYKNSSGNLNLLLLDDRGQILSECKDVIKKKDFAVPNRFSVIAAAKTIYLYSDCDYGEMFKLRSFDESLNLLCEIGLEDEVYEFATYENNMLMFFEVTDYHYVIHEYNPALDICQELGQRYSHLPYCFGYYKGKLLVNNDYYVIGHGIQDDEDHIDIDEDHIEEVTVINKATGILVKTFNISVCHDITLYSGEYLCAYNTDTAKLCVYDLKGDLQCKADFDQELVDSNVPIIFKKKVSFFIRNKLSLVSF